MRKRQCVRRSVVGPSEPDILDLVEDGTAGQVLTTDGAGGVTFEDFDLTAIAGTIDKSSAGALLIGPTTATSVELGSASAPTEIKGDLKYNKAQCEWYMDTDSTTAIAIADTWTPVALAVAPTVRHTKGFTINAVTGEVTVVFSDRSRYVHCGCTFSAKLASGGNDQLSFSVFDTTGTPTLVAGTEVDMFVGNNVNESQSTAIHFFPVMTQNQKFRLYCKNVSATDDVILKHINWFMVATPGYLGPEVVQDTMTSNILPSPNVSSASSIFGVLYEPFKAFDKIVSTFWSSADFSYTSPGGTYPGAVSTTIEGVGDVKGEWLQIDFGDSKTLVSYRMHPRSSNLSRMPYDYYLVYSSDGTTWYQADRRTEITFSAAYRTFTLPAEKAGRYWRIVIDALKPGASSNSANIGELEYTYRSLL